MQILIVEDDDFKVKQLQAFLNSELGERNISVAKSVTSGMRSIRSEEFQLILLDMSLSTYDIQAGEAGGRPQPFGGREIMGYIERLDLQSKVIVITQFPQFGIGADQMDLATLHTKLTHEYPSMLLGLVQFNHTSSQWRDDLLKLLKSNIQE